MMKETAQLATLFAVSNLWMADGYDGVALVARRNGLKNPRIVCFRDNLALNVIGLSTRGRHPAS